jgi:hypothetical protein
VIVVRAFWGYPPEKEKISPEEQLSLVCERRGVVGRSFYGEVNVNEKREINVCEKTVNRNQISVCERMAKNKGGGKPSKTT